MSRAWFVFFLVCLLSGCTDADPASDLSLSDDAPEEEDSPEAGGVAGGAAGLDEDTEDGATASDGTVSEGDRSYPPPETQYRNLTLGAGTGMPGAVADTVPWIMAAGWRDAYEEVPEAATFFLFEATHDCLFQGPDDGGIAISLYMEGDPVTEFGPRHAATTPDEDGVVRLAIDATALPKEEKVNLTFSASWGDDAPQAVVECSIFATATVFFGDVFPEGFQAIQGSAPTA